MDSWIVSHRLEGSITRSYAPASTLGARIFSASSEGISDSSASQSQPPAPVRYSQPRPTGGARVRMESKSPVDSSTATAVSWGCSRTRCWVVVVPAESA